MSRSHMLYDDSAMSALPVKITRWNGTWNPDLIFKRSGNGYIIEATILGKSKHQIVEGQTKLHYICLHVSILKSMRRKFDGKGDEIEPDLGDKKKVNTGYLMSSYKDVSKEGEDIISPSEMKKILSNKQLEDLLSGKLQTYNQANYVSAVWCDLKQLEGTELPNGAKVRLRTKGNGCFLESILCLDEDTTTKQSFTTHSSVGGSWTDKVLDTKDEKGAKAHLTKESEGVDEDEWDD